MDETWIHQYTPETKQQSKQWTGEGEPTPEKANVSDITLRARSEVTKKSQLISPNNLAPVENSKNSE